MAILRENFILLKYLLSEEFSSLWSHKDLDQLLHFMFKMQSTQGLVCLLSSPSFAHYYESKDLFERKQMKNLIVNETKSEEFNRQALGDALCNQPYCAQYLMHLIQLFMARSLDDDFENFHKAVFNVNIYQLEWLSQFEDYERECHKFIMFMKIQDAEDEYTKNGHGLLGKIAKVAKMASL